MDWTVDISTELSLLTPSKPHFNILTGLKFHPEEKQDIFYSVSTGCKAHTASCPIGIVGRATEAPVWADIKYEGVIPPPSFRSTCCGAN
jgi:hypothetical protein